MFQLLFKRKEERIDREAVEMFKAVLDERDEWKRKFHEAEAKSDQWRTECMHLHTQIHRLKEGLNDGGECKETGAVGANSVDDIIRIQRSGIAERSTDGGKTWVQVNR